METEAGDIQDRRTLREYLRDVEEIERKGLYKQYSKVRTAILEYWTEAVERGLVSLDDPVYLAIQKMESAKKTSR